MSDHVFLLHSNYKFGQGHLEGQREGSSCVIRGGQLPKLTQQLHAAMVPGLVLFKVKQGSRKKEQIYGFYIQIKNILTTFPQKISKFGP